MLLLSNNGLTEHTKWRDLAVAGGLLFDLVDAGRITVSSDAVVVRDERPNGLPAFDAALRQLRFVRSPAPDAVAETLVAVVRQQARNQLAQEEIARGHQLSKKTVVWQVLRPEDRDALRNEVGRAIVAGTTTDDELRSVIAAVRAVRAEEHVLQMSSREFHAVAGHIVYERHWHGVVITEALELAKISLVRQDYERQIQEAYARGRAAGH
jgi:hypothetical protein